MKIILKRCLCITYFLFLLYSTQYYIQVSLVLSMHAYKDRYIYIYIKCTLLLFHFCWTHLYILIHTDKHTHTHTHTHCIAAGVCQMRFVLAPLSTCWGYFCIFRLSQRNVAWQWASASDQGAQRGSDFVPFKLLKYLQPKIVEACT